MPFDTFANSLQFANVDAVFGTDGTPQNLNTFNTNLEAFTQLAINRAKWESSQLLPETNASFLIEWYCYFKGQCFLIPPDKPGDKWKVYQGVQSGSLDEYGQPAQIDTCDFNGNNHKIRDLKDIVWIKNTPRCVPTWYWVLKYCNRISNYERIMDLNSNAQKTPYLIQCKNNTYLSVKELYKKIRQMDDVIFAEEIAGFGEAVKVLNLQAPYLLDKLFDQKINERNDLLNFLGMNTIYEKNAHIIYAETTATNEITQEYDDMFLSPRREALRDAHEKGLEDLKMYTIKAQEEGNDNGTLHGDAERSDRPDGEPGDVQQS